MRFGKRYGFNLSPRFCAMLVFVVLPLFEAWRWRHKVPPIQKFSGSPTLSIFGDYTGRITASVNDTFTSISLIPVKRTDCNTHTFALQTGQDLVKNK